MQRALERQKRGEAEIIPILLRPVDWKDDTIHISAITSSQREAITNWSNQDEAFKEVVEGIRSVIEEKFLTSTEEIECICDPAELQRVQWCGLLMV